jgi:hypothetical protein
MLQRFHHVLKKYKRWVIALFVIGAIFLISITLIGPFLTRKAENFISEKLRSLHDHGILLKFDSLVLDPWSGSIRAKNIMFEKIPGKDSLTNPGDFKISLKYFAADGISLISLLIKNRLRLRSVYLVEPHVTLNPGGKSSPPKGSKAFEIVLDKLLISKCFFQIVDSTGRQPSFQTFFTIRLDDIHLSQDNIPATWKVGGMHTDAIEIRLPKHFYTFTIKQLRYNASDQYFMLDSLKITPWFEKTIFSEKTGKQTDRISGMVSFFKMKALAYTSLSKPAFKVENMDLKIDLDVYRDKRFPFIKEWQTVLPVEFVYQLPVSLTIDTLKLSDSFVAYTEHPEDGTQAGTIFFEDLQATIFHISNDSTRSINPAMHVQTSFMGAGDLSVDFKFPEKPGGAYFAKGALTGFPLPEVNTMLEPAAKIKIESGVMDILKFHFWYNDYRSDGSLELNYKNVKVLSLNDKDKKNPINRFVTFLINTFIVKKNMDESVPIEKKTGDIQFVRDKKRSIFNYWWKSLFSGIKSAYNMDIFKNSTDSK